jgi:hypothetical protein
LKTFQLHSLNIRLISVIAVKLIGHTADILYNMEVIFS